MMLDVCRWEGRVPGDEAVPHEKGRDVGVFSWDTMTDCVRNGVSVERDDWGGFTLEVGALGRNDPHGVEQKKKAKLRKFL